MHDWFAGREAVFFAALVIAHLVPIWWFQYFPSVDGPVHLSIADIMVRYHDPETPAFREFYEFNPNPVPNYFVYAVLYVVMQVLPPLVAEKVLLSLYVVALPLALRYAVGALAPEARVIALLGFPLIYNFPLHMGFYNFVFGMVFFLLAFGFWLKHSDRSSPFILAGYLVTSLLSYFCHLFALTIACLAIAFTTLGEMAVERLGRGRTAVLDAGSLWRWLRSRAVLPAAGYLPSLGLAGWFLLLHRADAAATGLAVTGSGIIWPTPIRLPMLMAATTLVGHEASEIVATKGYVAALVITAGLVLARATPGTRRVNGLFFCMLGIALVYFTVPEGYFAHWTDQRIMLYVYLAVILWLASQLSTAMPRRALLVAPWVVISVAAISLAGLGIRSAKYVELNDYIGEYMSAAEHVEANTTLLSLRVSRTLDGKPFSDRIGLFLQTGAYIALERSAVDLKNVQAGSPYFPIRYRPERNPFDSPSVDASFVMTPPGVDLRRYGARMGTTIDYVLLWGTDEKLRDEPHGQRLMAELGATYELIFTSPRRGLARLYRRKPAAAGPPAG